MHMKAHSCQSVSANTQRTHRRHIWRGQLHNRLSLVAKQALPLCIPISSLYLHWHRSLLPLRCADMTVCEAGR